MNRCHPLASSSAQPLRPSGSPPASQPSRAWHVPTHRVPAVRTVLLAFFIAAAINLVCVQSEAQAQSAIRSFPAVAKRGVLEVQTWPGVLINGSAERLSPGARIRGPNNLLMLSGQLVGQRLVVNYVRDAQGMVHEVWVLNAMEAQLEREGSEPTKNWFFESEPVKTP